MDLADEKEMGESLSLALSPNPTHDPEVHPGASSFMWGMMMISLWALRTLISQPPSIPRTTKSRLRSFSSASSVHVGDDDDDFSLGPADFDKPDSERSSHNQKSVEELL